MRGAIGQGDRPPEHYTVPGAHKQPGLASGLKGLSGERCLVFGSVLVQALVEVKRVVGVWTPPLALSGGPVRFAVAEQLIQWDTGIFLIKLLAVVGGAGIPAIAAQGRIVARHAQLIHRAIHRLKQPFRGSFRRW